MTPDQTWTNGSYKISWDDIDTVRIDGPYGQRALIDGGDLERQRVVDGLANSGYKTWVEERNRKDYSLSSGDFYVCFELTEDKP